MVAEVSEAAVVVLEGEAVSVVEVADLEVVAVAVLADEEAEGLVVLLDSEVVDAVVANPHLQILVRKIEITGLIYYESSF